MKPTQPQARSQPDVADIGIALWRRERPDIDCGGRAVTARMLRLADMFISAMNADMGRFGISYSHFLVVGALRAAGRPYRMSPTDLQNALMITSGGVSNLLRKVEALGLIQRLNHPSDGRGVIVELTDKGFALSESAMRTQADTERRLVGALSAQEQGALAELLKKLVLANS